jgi:hypothetical protein
MYNFFAKYLGRRKRSDAYDIQRVHKDNHMHLLEKELMSCRALSEITLGTFWV